MSATPEVKLAKVGEERKERKKAGLPLLGGLRASESSFLGATGGSGLGGAVGEAAGVAGAAIPKIAAALIVSASVAGAWMITNIAHVSPPLPQHKKKIFAAHPVPKADDYASSDIKNLPTDARAQSGLAMVSGSLNDKSASAGDASKAGDSGKAGDAGKADAAPATTTPAPSAPSIDPAALAAAAAGKGAGAGDGSKSKLAGKIGALSSALGGGGGGGVSLNGGAGLAGGLGGGFSRPLGDGLRAFANAAAPARVTARSGAPSNRTRGLAGSQLNKAAAFSRMANRAEGTNASYLASQPFDNGVATDKMIGDQGGARTQGAQLQSTGSNNDGGGGGGGGGPTSAGSASGLSTPSQDDCSQLLDSSFGNQPVHYVNSSSGGCVLDLNDMGDQSPWKDVMKWGKFALLVAGILLTISGIVAFAAQKMAGGLVTLATAAMMMQIAMYLAYAAAALGAIAAMCGIAAIAMGSALDGGIMTGLGALTAILAMKAASGDSEAGQNFKNAEQAQTQAAQQEAQANSMSGQGDNLAGQAQHAETAGQWGNAADLHGQAADAYGQAANSYGQAAQSLQTYSTDMGNATGGIMNSYVAAGAGATDTTMGAVGPDNGWWPPQGG